MPKSKRVANYSQRLLQIAQTCGKSITIPLGDVKKSQALRFEIYGLRRAIKHEGADGMYPDFMRAKVRLEPNGDLTIGPPEDFDDMLAGLELELPPLPPSATMPEQLDAQPWEESKAPFDPYEAFANPKERE